MLKPKVGVVILNFKVKAKTLNCIASVQKSDFKNLEIIVVDNDSQDGLEDEIKKINSIHFIQTGANLGYTGGNNLGIKKALSLSCEYIFVLNPDTKVDKNCISNLISTFADQQAGVVGPKILFPNKKIIWFAGGKLDLNNIIGSHIGVDEEDQGQYDQIREVDYISGGAMFVKAEVFGKVGYFDDRYFLYYEDSDLCFRAKKAGFKILYQPKAVVYHENAQSSGLGSPLQDYFLTRNRMLFAKKFLPLKTRLALVREAIRNSRIPTRRQALKDYLLGNFGKGSFLK